MNLLIKICASKPAEGIPFGIGRSGSEPTTIVGKAVVVFSVSELIVTSAYILRWFNNNVCSW